MSKQDALDNILNSLASYQIDGNTIALTSTILGRGGSGIVRLGRSLVAQESEALVAVKQLHPTSTEAQNTKIALALARELHVWAGLAHPHVIHLVGFCLDGRMDKAWLVSPYMKNGNIRNYLNLHRPDMIVRLRMLGEVARGVAYLHRRNLCHGDIKGANVLVDDNGQAKVSDFGLTKLMEGETGCTASSGLDGTIRYMAPEFFHDERPTRTKQTDVWAWSCLGLEVLFDQIPYSDLKIDAVIIRRIMLGKPPLDLESIDIDEGLKQLFWKCWVAKPIERADMRTCAASAKEVLEVMSGQVGAKPNEPALAVRHDDTSAIDVGDSDDEDAHVIHPTSSNETREMGDAGTGLVSENPPSEASQSPSWNIEMYRQELLRCPESSLYRGNILCNLARLLLNEYVKGTDVANLEEAIEIYRQALLFRPEGHPERPEILVKLAFSLWSKYRKQGSVASLDESIHLDRQALLLRPEEHPGQSTSCYNLAVSLLDRYRKGDCLVDLHEAIDLHRQALGLRPESDPGRSNSFCNLAISLPDLHEAIDLYYHELQLQRLGHPEYHHSLHGLAVSLLANFDKNGSNALLYEVIDLERQALQLQPAGRPERVNSMRILSMALERKFGREGQNSDRNEVIFLCQQLLVSLPTGDQLCPGIEVALSRMTNVTARHIPMK